MWGGWKPNVDELARTAYRLNKMTNRWSLMGIAAENTIMRLLRQQQAGNPMTADEAYEAVARPFLRKCWGESKREKWKENPKQFCCLREHYYGTMTDEKATGAHITEQIKNCVKNFIQLILPRIKTVTHEQELPIKTPEMGGDPENITWNGIKMYVIPDYAYRVGGAFHIHDWKAGKIKESHREQLGLYAIWAREKFRATPEETFLYVEYLNEGQVAPFQMTAKDFDAIEGHIERSVAGMTEYLVDFDREKNRPLPKEEWELAADPTSCSDCKFYELCKDELDEK